MDKEGLAAIEDVLDFLVSSSTNITLYGGDLMKAITILNKINTLSITVSTIRLEVSLYTL